MGLHIHCVFSKLNSWVGLGCYWLALVMWLQGYQSFEIGQLLVPQATQWASGKNSQSHTLTGDRWYQTPDTWHRIRDTWHVTCDTWHLTYYTRLGEHSLKFQGSNFSGFGETLFWRYVHKGSVRSLNYKAVCRTAPATPGLSIRGLVLQYWNSTSRYI